MRCLNLKVCNGLALCGAAFGCLVSAMPAAATLLFDRGLPTINLNNAAGANRSNVSWVGGADPDSFAGDNFSIGVTGEKYRINSLTVWGAQVNPLSDDLLNIELYLGKSGSALSLLSAGVVTGNTDSNPNITHTPGVYPSTGTGYQGTSGTYYSVMQTVFSGLDLEIDGGVLYNFGVWGDGVGWYSHASNAGLSGSTQQGADNQFMYFDRNDLSAVLVRNSADQGVGWDKSSDINVQIDGTQIPNAVTVPEPSSLGLVVAAVTLAGLATVRRRQS